MKDTILRLIPIFITIIGLLIAALTWAASEHTNLREKITNESNSIKVELKQEIKENTKEIYVPRYEFSAQKEQIKELRNQNQTIINSINHLDKKMDNMLLKENRREYPIE